MFRLDRFLITAALGLALALPACQDDGNGEGESGARPVTGLETCTRRLPGYHYIGYALKGASDNAELVRKAVILALTEINTAGGIRGRHVGLVECDTEAEPVIAADVIAELGGAAPLSGVVGTGTSGTMIAAMAAAVSGEIPLISPAATSPEITALLDEGYLFRTAVSDDFQGNILAHIARREGFDAVTIISVENSWGDCLRDVFVARFPEVREAAGNGAGEVQLLSFDASALDAAALVTAAQDWGPDAVLLIATADDGAAVIKTAANAGWYPRWLLTDGIKGPNLVQQVGAPDALEGALGTAPAAPVGPQYETFAAAFEAAWDEAPFTFSATGYDATYLLVAAMALAPDPDDGALVRDALAATSGGDARFGPGQWATAIAAMDAGATTLDYQGASGDVDLDENGDVQGNIEEWAIRDGVFVTEGCWTPAGAPCPER
jgi:branched-chain amino acid transport system substrate-binding protein